MKKTLFILISILFVQSAFAQNILDKYPRPTTSVADFENIFTNQEEAFFNSLIKIYYKQADAVISIVTINENSITTEQFDNLILQIANSWGIGSAKKNNGILIGISSDLRRIRIQNGSEIETRMTNEETNKIIETIFIPKFKEGQYYEGTREGMQAIINHLKNN